MQPLNLAQAKLVERAGCRRHVSSSVRTAALLLSALIVAAVVTTEARGIMRSRTARAVAELSQSELRCAALKRDVDGLESAVRERAWRKQLLRLTVRWMRVLDGVTLSATPEIWLRSVQVADSQASVTVEGSAASYEALAAFANKLRGQSSFSEVVLRNSKSSGTSAGEALDFTLELSLPAAPSQAPAAAQPAPAAPSVPEVK